MILFNLSLWYAKNFLIHKTRFRKFRILIKSGMVNPENPGRCTLRLSQNPPPWYPSSTLFRWKTMRASQAGSIKWTSLSCIFPSSELCVCILLFVAACTSTWTILETRKVMTKQSQMFLRLVALSAVVCTTISMNYKFGETQNTGKP